MLERGANDHGRRNEAFAHHSLGNLSGMKIARVLVSRNHVQIDDCSHGAQRRSVAWHHICPSPSGATWRYFDLRFLPISCNSYRTLWQRQPRTTSPVLKSSARRSSPRAAAWWPPRTVDAAGAVSFAGGRSCNGRSDTVLIFQEFQDLLQELEPRLLEQHEVRRVRDKHALLGWRVHQVAHEPLAVFRKRPRVEGSGNDQRRRIDVRRVPERPTGRLIEGIFEHTIGRTQARGIARVAGGIGCHAFLPEFDWHGRVAVLVLVIDWYLAIPTTRVGSLGG